MKVETVFRIFHKLQKKSSDFCAKVEITSAGGYDLFNVPTEVGVKFIPLKPRKLSSTEISILKPLCKYHKLRYEINEKGEMLWYQE
jgi:hypothetical protein